MKSYRAEGFIISLKNIGETDTLVTFFTKEKGYIQAICKGARKPLSKMGQYLDLLNYVKASFYIGKELDLVTEIEEINSFLELKSNLTFIAQIFYILEVLVSFTKYLEDHKKTYDMFLNLLNLLKISNNLKILYIRSFEIKLLDQLGFGPILDRCLHTGLTFKANELRIAASNEQAGYIVTDLKTIKYKKDILVNDDIIKIQRYLLANPLENAISIKITNFQKNRLKSIQRSWLQGVLEYSLKTMQFVDEIENKYGN